MNHTKFRYIALAAGAVSALLVLALWTGLIGGSVSAQPSSTAAPSIIGLSVSSSGIHLEWEDGATEQEVRDYDIARSPGTGSFTTIASGTESTSFLDTFSGARIDQLDSGSRWSYRVRANIEDAEGNITTTGWSGTQSTSLPTFPRPSGVQFGWQGPGSAATLYFSSPTLSWSNQALPQTGYAILRSRYTGANPNSGTISLIATAGISNSEQSRSDTPPSDANYAYAVVATYGVFYSTHTGWFAAN